MNQYKPQTQRRLARILAECKHKAIAKPVKAYAKTGKGKEGFDPKAVKYRGKACQVRRMPVTGTYV